MDNSFSTDATQLDWRCVNIRKRLILLCFAMLMVPVGVIALLLRILYYRASSGAMEDAAARQPVMSVLMDHYAVALTVLSLLSLIAIIFTGAFFMRGLLRPIRELTRVAREIERGNLDFVIAYDGKDEFSQVFTQFDRMRVKLKDSLWKQVQDEESKAEMIANIAHDLRTPITSIQGYAQGILEGIANTEEKKQKYLETIVTKTGELSRMSESLSTFADIGRQDVSIEKTNVNVREFVDGEVTEMSMILQSAEVTFDIEISEKTRLDIDVMQVRRVFSNILQNSLKYKGDGTAKLHIRAYENDRYVLFCFADQGLGVKDSELKLIFNRFYRSDLVRQDTRNGSGLGLAIAKQIVLLHGGYIWARHNMPRHNMPEQNTQRGLQIFVSFPRRGVDA